MKKGLFFSAAILAATTAWGQVAIVNPARIKDFNFKSATQTPVQCAFQAANAASKTDGTEPNAAILESVVIPTADLSNLTLEASLNDPNGVIVGELPTNFSSTVTVKTNGSETPTPVCKYNIVTKKVIPADLPLTIVCETWTTQTIGWAGTRTDIKSPSLPGKGSTIPVIQYNGLKQSVIVAIKEPAQSINFKIMSAGPDDNANNVFNVFESTDGIEWGNTIASHSVANNNLATKEADIPASLATVSLNSSTRFIKLELSERSGGNFYIWEISIDKSTSISAPELLEAKTFIENDELVIASNENIAKIQIYNNAGQLLKEATNTTRVNLSDIAPSSLIIKVVGESGKSNSSHIAK